MTVAQKAGDTVDVAIGGTVQVMANVAVPRQPGPTAPVNGSLVVSSSVNGDVEVSTTPAYGSLVGKALSRPDTNGLIWVLITLN